MTERNVQRFNRAREGVRAFSTNARESAAAARVAYNVAKEVTLPAIQLAYADGGKTPLFTPDKLTASSVLAREGAREFIKTYQTVRAEQRAARSPYVSSGEAANAVAEAPAEPKTTIEVELKGLEAATTHVPADIQAEYDRFLASGQLVTGTPEPTVEAALVASAVVAAEEKGKRKKKKEGGLRRMLDKAVTTATLGTAATMEYVAFGGALTTPVQAAETSRGERVTLSAPNVADVIASAEGSAAQARQTVAATAAAATPEVSAPVSRASRSAAPETPVVESAPVVAPLRRSAPEPVATAAPAPIDTAEIKQNVLDEVRPGRMKQLEELGQMGMDLVNSTPLPDERKAEIGNQLHDDAWVRTDLALGGDGDETTPEKPGKPGNPDKPEKPDKPDVPPEDCPPEAEKPPVKPPHVPPPDHEVPPPPVVTPPPVVVTPPPVVVTPPPVVITPPPVVVTPPPIEVVTPPPVEKKVTVVHVFTAPDIAPAPAPKFVAPEAKVAKAKPVESRQLAVTGTVLDRVALAAGGLLLAGGGLAWKARRTKEEVEAFNNKNKQKREERKTKRAERWDQVLLERERKKLRKEGVLPLGAPIKAEA